MDLAETELKIGNTSFKGVYIAILLSLATTLGSGIWAASTLYSRLVDVEDRSIPDIKPIEERVGLIEQELEDNSVSSLQGKLAELGTNLVVIKDQQAGLLTIQKQVTDLEKQIESMKVTVAKGEVIVKDLGDVDDKLKDLSRNVEELWQGLDYLSNPLSGN
jgi:tetrahydromethanopterin S-methyltransferase subunit B